MLLKLNCAYWRKNLVKMEILIQEDWAKSEVLLPGNAGATNPWTTHGVSR